MSFGSQKLVHTDGTMHHLGIDAVTPRVILVPDPQEVPLYAALLEGSKLIFCTKKEKFPMCQKIRTI